MTEEEKQAIERLNRILIAERENNNIATVVRKSDLQVVLNLIDKQKLDKQKLIEINDKYLQKLVYALSPTQHALGDNYNNAFKQIIAENIDLETCKIKRKLKECWGIDKKY